MFFRYKILSKITQIYLSKNFKTLKRELYYQKDLGKWAVFRKKNALKIFGKAKFNFNNDTQNSLDKFFLRKNML